MNPASATGRHYQVAYAEVAAAPGCLHGVVGLGKGKPRQHHLQAL